MADLSKKKSCPTLNQIEWIDRFFNTFLTTDQIIFLRALYLSLWTPFALTVLKYFFRIYFRILKTYPNFFLFFINTHLKTNQKSNLRSHTKKTHTHRKLFPGKDTIPLGYFIKNPGRILNNISWKDIILSRIAFLCVYVCVNANSYKRDFGFYPFYSF